MIYLLIGTLDYVHAQVSIHEDFIHDKNVKTVRLFPLLNSPEEQSYPSAIPLRGNTKLLLEFDVLQDEFERMLVKLVHCNSDWSTSRLFPLDYLDDYNEFPINEYEFSFNTRVPYVHYTFIVPEVKVSGNYALIVYSDDAEEPIFIKRFLVFDSRVAMTQDYQSLGSAALTRDNQEIQFEIKYRGAGITNPSSNIKAVIKQNQRWDNAIIDLSPTFVNSGLNQMEFRHFTGENQFKAGNQFRWFDLQSLEYFGRNVETVDLKPRVPLAILATDEVRGHEAYSEYRDRNGKYEIPHPYEADYAQVEFFLESKQLKDPVYLAGDFSQWVKSDYYKLEYFEERRGYYGLILLKQGIYDYQYLVGGQSKDPNSLEGNFFQTENEYEILIYYYSFEIDADLLIGYFNISRNPRY